MVGAAAPHLRFQVAQVVGNLVLRLRLRPGDQPAAQPLVCVIEGHVVSSAAGRDGGLNAGVTSAPSASSKPVCGLELPDQVRDGQDR